MGELVRECGAASARTMHTGCSQEVRAEIEPQVIWQLAPRMIPKNDVLTVSRQCRGGNLLKRVIAERRIRIAHDYGGHVRPQGVYQWPKLLPGTVEAGQQYG